MKRGDILINMLPAAAGGEAWSLMNYSVIAYSTVCDVEDFVASCVDVPKFLGFCRECHNYGNNWMCPPFDFDPLDIWRSYEKIKLFGLRMTPARESGEGKSAAERAKEIISKEKRRLIGELLEEEKKIPGSLSFFAGSCELCPVCAKVTNEPCRRPAMARHSIESLGADVSLAMKRYLGLDILWIKDDRLPEYLTLVAALLLPR